MKMFILYLLDHLYYFYIIYGILTHRGQDGFVLLDNRYGFVNNESFVYFYLQRQGVITITLTSNYGDADLYISQTHLTPTYEVDSYDFHSATCGVDVVKLSDEGITAIGIYGHPSYQTSTFFLEIFATDHDGFIQLDDEVPKVQMTTAGKKIESQSEDKDVVHVIFKQLARLMWFLEII